MDEFFRMKFPWYTLDQFFFLYFSVWFLKLIKILCFYIDFDIVYSFLFIQSKAMRQRKNQ